jgi:hypothetical protein
MSGDTDTSEQSWRLRAQLTGAEPEHALRGLIGRLRGPEVVLDSEHAVARDVLITHDGSMLFAYAFTRESLQEARTAIEGVLLQDGYTATMSVSHWDGSVDEWLQVDPPLTGVARATQEQTLRDEKAVETRTLVASSGRAVRSQFEQIMTAAADRLGLECQILEHPHALTEQVAFTVTGPRHKIDEFAADLRAEGVASMRAERAVILSPL